MKEVSFVFLFFFFSSRRRHTRFDCDWSSDVCSSDLIEGKTGTFAKKSYKYKAGWIPYAEVLLGIYFSLTVVYAITNDNYGTVPFLLLFVWGYFYTGVMSLGQTYFAHLRFGVNAPEMRPAASGAPGF